MSEIVVVSDTMKEIVEDAPNIYNVNKTSHDRCLEYGQKLLNESAAGMNPELDEKMKVFIVKARKTAALMNERRTRVTKLFDMVRSSYTSMENEVDPSNSKSIAYRVQAVRDAYAYKIKAEEERKRQEELRKVQVENARKSFSSDVENDYKNQVNNLVRKFINKLQQIVSDVTLENYDDSYKRIEEAPSAMLEHFSIVSGVSTPALLDLKEAEMIKSSIYSRIESGLIEQFQFELESNRDDILEMLPSKKMQLEAAAKASKEEAERIKKEIAEREAAEAARKQKEMEAKEEKKAVAVDANMLFSVSAAAAPIYVPKTSVKTMVSVNNPAGILEVIQLWWNEEGKSLTVEELEKIFKKQITFANKMANKAKPVMIESPNVTYVEEVKAK